MLNAILNAIFGNPYLFFWFLGMLGFFAFGWAVTDMADAKRFHRDIKAWQVGDVFALLWTIIGGLLLLFIWALLTISVFFGIPLLVLLALLFVVAVVGILFLRPQKTLIYVSKK